MLGTFAQGSGFRAVHTFRGLYANVLVYQPVSRRFIKDSFEGILLTVVRARAGAPECLG